MTVSEGEKKTNPCTACGRKFQTVVIGGLERLFGKYGALVARYPWAFILGSLLFCLLTLAGILNFYEEKDGSLLWIPSNSDFKQNSDYIDNAKKGDKEFVRYNNLLVFVPAGKNILTADNIRKLYQLRKDVLQLKNDTWETLCDQIPVGSNTGAVSAWPDMCTAMASVNRTMACNEMHILEYWANNNTFNDVSDAEIASLTDQAVLDKLNTPTSGLSGAPLIPEFFLGRLVRENDMVKSAEATTMSFFGKPVEGAMEFETPDEDAPAMHFETKFIDTANEDSSDSMVILPFTQRSFGDVAGSDIQSDSTLLAMGYFVVIAFVMIMLGQFNSTHQRAWLSLSGILAVGMGIGSSIGLCSLFGLDYTGLHSILPFLLLGIGIDDMFVIVQSYDNLKEEEMLETMVRKISLSMIHAGVAITITSVTDLLAFGIGGTTVLPALRSFCIYAAIGIFFVFLYMITFFLGWFVFNERRSDDRRDACCCCIKWSEDYQPNKCSQRSLIRLAFEKYAAIIVTIPAKIVVIVLTCVIVGVAIYGTTELETNFEVEWFLDESTYLRQWFDKNKLYFPKQGIEGSVHIGSVDGFEKYTKQIDSLARDIGNDPNLDQTNFNKQLPFVLANWINSNKLSSSSEKYPNATLTNEDFRTYLAEFLHSGIGRSYRNEFIFESELTCNETTPKIQVIKLKYQHKGYSGASEHVEKINQLHERVAKHKDNFGPGAKVFAHSSLYSNYVTIEIISEELMRNIGLALLCVFLATVILIGDIITSIIVVLNVTMVIADVCGYMYFWGLSIDTIAAVLITIAMGLAVDYSAHIAHAFMTNHGTRNERVSEALVEMGPAVFNGGFSTFLAFALLMTSASYIFKTFFKIFFLVVVFGLFHGLVFLPVILSLIGPGTAASAHDDMPPTVAPMDESMIRASSAWDRKQSIKTNRERDFF